MAISLLGTAATASANTATTVSATHTLSSGSNRIAIAVVSFYKGTSFECTGVTYGGVAMTKITNSGNHTSVFRDISAWYLLEASLPANGSKTVTATVGASSLNLNIHVFTIQDAKQQAHEVSGTYLVESSATSSISITTVAAGAWAFSCAAADATSSYTHGTGQTEITDTSYTGASSTTMTMSTSYEEITSPSSVTQTDTLAVGNRRHVGVAFSFAPTDSVTSTQVAWFM